MTLEIDNETVTGILLADGWHNVTDGSFYAEDGFAICTRGKNSDGERVLMAEYASMDSAFSFDTPDGGGIIGPMGSVLAVRWRPLTSETR